MRNARAKTHESIAIRLHAGADDPHRDVAPMKSKHRLDLAILNCPQQLTAEALPNQARRRHSASLTAARCVGSAPHEISVDGSPRRSSRRRPDAGADAFADRYLFAVFVCGEMFEQQCAHLLGGEFRHPVVYALDDLEAVRTIDVVACQLGAVAA